MLSLPEGTVWWASLLACTCADRAADPRPNVVLLVSDDAGWGDFSMHGGDLVGTPHIDRLAAEGVRFSQGYATAPVCSPSRAGLLTGRYPQRFGHEFNPPRTATVEGLPLSETLLPERLREAGYATLGYGKWHLGAADAFHPTARGFDVWYGFRRGERPHRPLARGHRDERLERGTEPVAEQFEWLSTHLAEAAAADIRAVADRPFFAYLAFPAVHAPLAADPIDLAAVAPGVEDRRREGLAMVHGLDRAVGVVLDALDEAGVADRTLVVFVNDNGAGPKNHGSNAPLRGLKGTPFEGGQRVPFVVRWPGVVSPGAVFEAPVSAMDVVPTALAAAGVAVPEGLDGVDLRPWLTGARHDRPHEALFWRIGASFAIRERDLKLVSYVGEPAELFDLAADPGETTDLFAARPEDAARLRARWDAWAAELAAPLWR